MRSTKIGMKWSEALLRVGLLVGRRITLLSSPLLPYFPDRSKSQTDGSGDRRRRLKAKKKERAQGGATPTACRPFSHPHYPEPFYKKVIKNKKGGFLGRQSMKARDGETLEATEAKVIEI